MGWGKVLDCYFSLIVTNTNIYIVKFYLIVMENIQLEDRIIEEHSGKDVDTAPALLSRQEKGEGIILSEADIRLLGVRNSGNAPQIADYPWDTSTLLATKGEEVKIILPYETDSTILTEAARFGLGLINPSEELVNGGVNLDVEDRWEKLDGKGVYTKQRSGWFEKEGGELIGLNEDMTEEQARKCPLLLTKLGHPDYVDSGFARQEDEVAEIIGETFRLGKQKQNHKVMMMQYLPEVSNKGVLTTWFTTGFNGKSGSHARHDLSYKSERLAFSIGNAKKSNTERTDISEVREESKETILTTNQIYFAIKNYVASANEQDVRNALDELTKKI